VPIPGERASSPLALPAALQRAPVLCCALILPQTATGTAGPAGRPPDALPAAEWTGTSWVGLLLYVFVFLLAAWWIYRLSGLGDSEPGERQG
jgi:hypothetical protein